jgi:thiamine biosynthesis lipoprotein
VTAAAPAEDVPNERFVEHVMGLPVTLALRGAEARTDTSSRIWRDVMAELTRIDTLFSTYRPESPISQIGRGQLAIDQGPAELPEVLELADEARAATDGAFDVWRTDAQGARIFDPSGVVKGWALQRAALALDALHDTGWCLGGGGDLACHAGPDGLPAWRIGIEDPFAPQHVIEVVELRDGGIATSGTAHRGEHIRDARDGRPPRGMKSVTVVADSLTHADIDATCGFLMGDRAADWLASRPIRSALLVNADGTTTTVEANARAH